MGDGISREPYRPGQYLVGNWLKPSTFAAALDWPGYCRVGRDPTGLTISNPSGTLRTLLTWQQVKRRPFGGFAKTKDNLMNMKDHILTALREQFDHLEDLLARPAVKNKSQLRILVTIGLSKTWLITCGDGNRFQLQE